MITMELQNYGTPLKIGRRGAPPVPEAPAVYDSAEFLFLNCVKLL